MSFQEVISPAEERFEKIRRTIGLFLGPALLIAIDLLPINLNPKAHHLAAILSLVIVWWITEAVPIPVTALLGPTLAVIFGVETAKKVFPSFADPVVFLFIGSFILAQAMSRHRLDQRIAYGLLALPGVGSDLRSILFVFGLISVIISMWISNTATTAMLMPIGIGILRTISKVYSKENGQEIDPKKLRYSTALMLMAAYGASVGGIGTPVGTPPNLIGIGLINNLLKIKISFFQWMLFAIPLVIIMYIVLYFLLLILHKPEINKIEAVQEFIKEARQRLGPLTPGQRNILIAFLLTVGLWVFPGFIAIFWGSEASVAKWYESHIPEAGAALLGAGILFVLPVNWQKREFTATLRDFTEIDWGTIILFGGGLSLGGLMFSTGLAESLGRAILNITGAHSLWAITAVSIALGIIFSELTSNTASANMVIPVMISLAQAANVNPLIPALGACIGASYGFMLPVSTPPNAIVYGSGMVPITRMIRTGILFDICGFLIIFFGLFLFLPLAGLR
ncbi:MAG: DASS family sodium-coupled anion symporter [candidate division WOR-3 bacterium]